MKNTKKLTAVLLSLSMIVSSAVLTNPTDASAAEKVALSTKKLTVKVGQSRKLKLKNNEKKVKWVVTSGKKNITLKNKKKTGITVVGKREGTAKIQAKVGKRKYSCKVTVKARAKVTVKEAGPTKQPSPVLTAQPAGTVKPTAPPTVASEGKEQWEIATENGWSDFDTINMCGGNSHLQGICVDDKMEYMYFSYTDVLAKVDMRTGKVVASIGGFGPGSFTATGGAHLGCLAYYDGRIYASLEYKSPGKKFFAAVFDESKITEIGMDINELSKKGEDYGVYAVLLEEPTADFRDPLNDEDAIIDSGSTDGTAINEQNLGHKFACSGIDGVTFAPMPGSSDDKIYMFVAYGVYGWENRNDNDYNVLQVYDPDEFAVPDENGRLRLFTYERGLESTYDENEALSAADTLYVFTGNTTYGTQNLEYDKDTGDIVLYTYANTKGWTDYTMYVVDGSKAPVVKELEVGQHNMNPDPSAQAEAIAKAETYKVDGQYPQVKHAILKSPIQGKEAITQAWGISGVTATIAGGTIPAIATTGICSLGGGYYYIANGSTTVGLYHRDDEYRFKPVTDK